MGGDRDAAERLKGIADGEMIALGIRRSEELGRKAVRGCGCMGDFPEELLFAVIEEATERDGDGEYVL